MKQPKKLTDYIKEVMRNIKAMLIFETIEKDNEPEIPSIHLFYNDIL